MMRFIVLTFVLKVCSSGVVKEQFASLESQTRFFFFPADDGDQLFLVDAEESVDQEYLRNYALNPNNVGYWLFTRANPTSPQVLKPFDLVNIQQTNFNSTKITIFLVHGWRNDGNTAMNKALTEAFLQDDDVNVIVLDWSKLAGKSYVTAKSGVVQVGKALGQFINWLADPFPLMYKKTHLVGFSLGGHLIGNAGRETGGRVKRITALDPAGPLFNNDDRVDQADAQYVEIIHTNSKWLGFSNPCGHADHYPNGGSGMPNCWLSSCSHSMAWKYMAATIKYNHLYANQCVTVDEAKKDKCNGVSVPMGNSDLNKSRHGIFRVNTQKIYPF